MPSPGIEDGCYDFTVHVLRMPVVFLPAFFFAVRAVGLQAKHNIVLVGWFFGIY